MSDADQVALRIATEADWGVLETGSGVYQDLRFNSESLQQATDTTQSGLIVSDRQISDFLRTAVRANGDITGDLTYGTYDTLLQYALLSGAWAGSTDATGPSTGISAAASDNSYNAAAGLGAHEVGAFISVRGFATAANNGVSKVLTSSATKITVIGRTLVDESAGPSVTIKEGQNIVNGTTLNSLSIEREYQDLAPDFAVYRGMVPNTLGLTIPRDGLITATFGFLGKDEQSKSSSQDSGTPVAANTNPVFSSVDNFSSCIEGPSGSEVALSIVSFEMSLNNNLRERLQPGSLGPISLGAGTVNVSGTLTAYYETAALANKYLDQSVTELVVGLQDANDNAYVLHLPSVKLAAGQRAAGGQNQDVILSIDFNAYKDATLGKTAYIYRMPA